MLYKIFLVLIVIIAYLICNMYWHKKIIEGKWLYTAYTTIILVIWFLFALTNFS